MELIESFSRLSFSTRDSKLNGFVQLNGAAKLIFTELKHNKNTNNVLQFDNTVQPQTVDKRLHDSTKKKFLLFIKMEIDAKSEFFHVKGAFTINVLMTLYQESSESSNKLHNTAG